MSAITKTRYLRLPFLFDVPRLTTDLEKVDEEDWTAHYNTATYTGAWRCVPLRSVDGRSDHIVSLPDRHYVDTPILARCPYFREVINSFECAKNSVRLMAMAPGSQIMAHRDAGTAFEDGIARLHVPILTTPEVLFTIDDEDMHFAAGHTWYLNADCLHGVRNESSISRIHLMLDCIVNPWLEELFFSAGFKPRGAAKYGDPCITDDNVMAIIAALQALDTQAGQEHAAKLAALRDTDTAS